MPALLLWALAALASPAPPHVEAWRSQVDLQALGEETVDLLSAYLQVDTVNPPGNEARAVDFIGARLDEEDIGWMRVEHRPGRDSLIARLPASGPSEGTLCLMSHTDVVGSEPEHWTVDPMSGEIRDGYIWGRGALDMKGMGALQLAVFSQLARQQVPLKMDVVLLAVADEEDENIGMKELVADHWDAIGCTHLLNEGGIGISDALFPGQALHAISVAEKGILWVKLIAEGPAGHGSTEEPGEATMRLLEAMAAVRDGYKAKPHIDESLYELLHAAGVQKRGATGAVLRSRSLVRLLVRPKLMARASTRSAITDTVHLTGMRGGTAYNVVPSRVEALYDCRLLRDTTPEQHLARLQRLTRKIEGVRWEVAQAELANGSEWRGDPLYEALVRYAVEDRPHAVAGPVLSVGFTDSLYARPLGVQAFGYVPFEVPAEEAETMHGHDERVSVANVHEGVRRLYSVVIEVAAAR